MPGPLMPSTSNAMLLAGHTCTHHDVVQKANHAWLDHVGSEGGLCAGMQTLESALLPCCCPTAVCEALKGSRCQ